MLRSSKKIAFLLQLFMVINHKTHVSVPLKNSVMIRSAFLLRQTLLLVVSISMVSPM
ncbi:hypothetical protein D3C72_2441110 [compost metagenome]